MYGVFVRVQDEQQAITTDYTKFAKSIHASIRDQLARRDQIDAHLASKIRLFKASNPDSSESENHEFTRASEDLKKAYATHKRQTMANIASLVKKQMTQDGEPYDAFVLGLAMYVAAYLVNAPLDEADNNVVNLVQEAFCKALHLKIKQSYPAPVKKLKYALKFQKVSKRMLDQITTTNNSQIVNGVAKGENEHEQRLLLDSLFRT